MNKPLRRFNPLYGLPLIRLLGAGSQRTSELIYSSDSEDTNINAKEHILELFKVSLYTATINEVIEELISLSGSDNSASITLLNAFLYEQITLNELLVASARTVIKEDITLSSLILDKLITKIKEQLTIASFETSAFSLRVVEQLRLYHSQVLKNTYNNTQSEVINIIGSFLEDIFVTISNIIALNDTVSSSITVFKLIDEIINCIASLIFVGNETLSETINIIGSVVEQMLLLIQENINVIDSATLSIIQTFIIQELINLTDEILLYAPEIVDELINIVGSLVDRYVLNNLESEIFTVSLSSTPILNIIILSEELIELSDNYNYNSSFINLLSENIIFVQKLVVDDIVFEGWVMNPEGFFVSTYSNYNFNSFAKYNDTYYGANSSGLFELTGTKDENAFITAKVQTAAMKFGTSNLKSVPQIYLGVSQDSKLVLKVNVDGTTTSYYELKIDSNNLSNQRIKLGKGAIGTYFQFELITKDSEEFNLESLEIYPMMLTRKIR